jgi:two-component system response regulator MprA
MPRILVVDDDPAVRAAILRALERKGHEVRVATTGLEGARMWRDAGADLVVLDVHMPEMDGIELLVQLRTLSPTVPILMVSGGAQSQDYGLLRDARLLGATAELAKPFSLPDLYAAVDRLLGLRS